MKRHVKYVSTIHRAIWPEIRFERCANPRPAGLKGLRALACRVLSREARVVLEGGNNQ